LPTSGTKAVFEGVPVKGLGPDVRRAGRIKLLMLDRARNLGDLRVPREIARRPCAVIVLVSTASGSTTNGASASSGAKKTPIPSRSRTITGEDNP
jgi:hypothetical protein